MGTAYNANIVTDGLVLCLDAANPRSYPGSGNTWYDISGRNNHATASSVSYNSSLRSFFTGVSGATSKFAIPSADLKHAEVTVEILMNTVAIRDGWIFCLQGETSSDYSKGYLLRMDSPSYDILWSPPAFIYASSQISINKWQHIVTTSSSSSKNIYVDGNIKQTASGGTLDYTGVRDYAYIMAFDGSGTLASYAYFNFIRVYSRSLTPEEIKKNYNATRGRYGI